MENIKELAPMERPREKLQYQGPQALSDAELLAILFGSGSKGLPVSTICDDLLRQVNLQQMPGADLQTLYKVKGIGEAKALILLAVVEFSRRLTSKPGTRLKNEAMVYDLLRSAFEHAEELQYILVLMTADRELLATAEAGIVLPGITWVTALATEAGAKRILLVRNGWLKFSTAEYNYKRKLEAAAGMLGIIAGGLMAIGDGRFKLL